MHYTLQGLAAVAFSMASYKADTVGAFSQAAFYCGQFVKAVLARWSGSMPSALQSNVINVNVPSPSGGTVKGFYLASMGRSSVLAGFHIASSRLTSQALQSLNLPEADPAVSVLTNTKASFQECDSTPGMKLAAMPQWIQFQNKRYTMRPLC